MLAPLNVAFSSSLQGVLVTSNASEISKLDRKDIRRIFLGLRPISQSAVTSPVINFSDHKTYLYFLRNIMFLTESGYKRKMIKRIFRQGADEIDSIDSIEELSAYLIQNPNTISFMLKEDASRQTGLKIIQALW